MLVIPCILFSDYKQYPFRFVINLFSFREGEQPQLSKYISFMYATNVFLLIDVNLQFPYEFQSGHLSNRSVHHSKTKMTGLIVIFYLMLLCFLIYNSEKNHHWMLTSFTFSESGRLLLKLDSALFIYPINHSHQLYV